MKLQTYNAMVACKLDYNACALEYFDAFRRAQTTLVVPFNKACRGFAIHIESWTTVEQNF